MPLPAKFQLQVTLSMGEHYLDSLDMLTLPECQPSVQRRSDTKVGGSEATRSSAQDRSETTKPD